MQKPEEKLFRFENRNYKRKNNPLLKYIFILLFSCYLYNPSNAQERKFIYDVIKDGKVIGKINFIEIIQGQKKFLSMTSDVETTLIFPITDHTAETAAFEKGVMAYSSFSQKHTGSDAVNKTTTLSGKFYKVTDNGESKSISLSPIHYNTLLLYTTVPNNIDKVYSGNFQHMLNIKKISENKYRLILPDGKVNDYTYKNGICTMVEIVRPLFTIQFALREK